MPVVAADAAGAVTVAGTLRDTSTHNDHYLTIRFAADGRELWRHRFAGKRRCRAAGPGRRSRDRRRRRRAGHRHIVERLRVTRRHGGGHRHAQVRRRRRSRAAGADRAPGERAVGEPDPADLAGQRRHGGRLPDRALRRARLHRVHADRGGRPRRDELRRRRPGAQQPVLVPRARVQRGRCLGLHERRDHEDAAQVMRSIRAAHAVVYRGVASAVRRVATGRFRGA